MKEIRVCAGGACVASGELAVKGALVKALKDKGLLNEYKIVETGCMGMCSRGPFMVVDDVVYAQLNQRAVNEIVEKHLVGGQIVEKYLMKTPEGKTVERAFKEHSFYKNQVKIVTRNLGIINPKSIDDYLEKDGYKALEKVLKEMRPEEVIEDIKKSGLRGRGGAGFPTGLKWEFAAKQKSDMKYMVCNADEGDPGAFMDRAVLEGDPHAVLEGMAIAAYAIGAKKGFIYVRAEYPMAIERLRVAIKQAKERGFLGEKIFGTDFSFDIEIRIGAGAFVCGEETALMASIMGERGQPRVRPPYPVQKGLWGKPTVINNVETLANIAWIIRNGWQEFRKYGTEKSPGTKVFALAGKVKNTGLVEVPLGITLRELIFDIGGGVPNGKKLKAVQTGGPSGGVIPASKIDTPIDYESLTALGTIMGSGGVIVLDEDDCMVDVAKFFLEFTVNESCGKCTPCREGTRTMYEILDRITKGEGTMEDIETLEELATVVKETSLCGLGQTAPNPVLTTLRYFKDEYIAHVKEKICPAKKCRDLISYVIDPDKCTGCTACKIVCPTNAIEGELNKVHIIHQDPCIRCGSCMDVCRFDAIYKVTPPLKVDAKV